MKKKQKPIEQMTKQELDQEMKAIKNMIKKRDEKFMRYATEIADALNYIKNNPTQTVSAIIQTGMDKYRIRSEII